VPKYESGCPPVIEKDVYPECPFGCVYCIARGRTPTMPTAVTAAADEAMVARAVREDRPVYLSPWSDPYPPVEQKERRTRALVEKLRNEQCAFYVITKSDLVVRDAALFADYPRSFIALSLNTVDDGVIARTEPTAPSSERRLEAIQALIALRTVKVVVKIDPILPGVTDGGRLADLLERLKELGPAAVTAETLRLNDAIRGRLLPVLSPRERSSLDRNYPAPRTEPVHPPLDYRMNIFKKIEAALGSRGIRTAFCRASLPVPVNANDCRGGF
jgi:DNA repair photolyase